jgi:hypothetical protein
MKVRQMAVLEHLRLSGYPVSKMVMAEAHPQDLLTRRAKSRVACQCLRWRMKSR